MKAQKYQGVINRFYPKTFGLLVFIVTVRSNVVMHVYRKKLISNLEGDSILVCEILSSIFIFITIVPLQYASVKRIFSLRQSSQNKLKPFLQAVIFGWKCFIFSLQTGSAFKLYWIIFTYWETSWFLFANLSWSIYFQNEATGEEMDCVESLIISAIVTAADLSKT